MFLLYCKSEINCAWIVHEVELHCNLLDFRLHILVKKSTLTNKTKNTIMLHCCNSLSINCKQPFFRGVNPFSLAALVYSDTHLFTFRSFKWFTICDTTVQRRYPLLSSHQNEDPCTLLLLDWSPWWFLTTLSTMCVS